MQIIFSFFFLFLFLLFCQVLRKIHLNLCKNVGHIGSAGRQSAVGTRHWVDGRQFSAVRYGEKVLCFCLTLLAALHYLISLHCAARSASASAAALSVLSVSSDRRNCLAIVFSCGKSRFYLKIMGKSHCTFVDFALSRKTSTLHFSLATTQSDFAYAENDGVYENCSGGRRVALAMGFSCAHFPGIRLMHKESVTRRTSEFAFNERKPSRPFQSCLLYFHGKHTVSQRGHSNLD